MQYIFFIIKLSLLIYLTSFVVIAETKPLVVKQRFETENFKTFSQQEIKKVAVGWESYGKLNANKDNAILITHYFSGNSHAAGKYAEDDPQAGYWDPLIGPNKAIDTNKYFVISVDSLANLGVYNEHVITTGPASLDPDTGKPYGLTFPVVTIRDFVNIQKLVLESLGVEKLHAVIGASMGSMQAIDWAATYPKWVPRVISVIGNAQTDAWTTALIERWTIPIKLDPNWNNGNYYAQTPPTEGLIAALMFITQDALTPEFINKVGGSSAVNHRPLEAKSLASILDSHRVVQWLRTRATTRAKTFDANHLLYLARASQLFIAGHNNDLNKSLSEIKAKILFLPSANDLLLMPYLSVNAHQSLKELGKASELETLTGNLGHLNGVSAITEKAQKIKNFIEQ
ncbi:E22 family MetX-like putative esterase [Paraglaciecola marina]|uniref:E22 family MetX-like putative esterase n=1 Tax=Paraglaciecola marina TaxID=2500157 RepID=UPI00106208E4|nr:homoserine O-acetyltransferase [Paraglaciecola marina]